ncbi:MAG: GLUG motif-containing protein [Faecousia sp.]
MRNMLKKAVVILLCLCATLSLPLTVLAEETEDAETGTVLRILRKQQFLDLAENCRLDSFSRDLTVVLLTDIDLSNVDFSGIPIFCGTFDGGGHTISGLSVAEDGSNMGLFRYVDSTAVIQNLAVSGDVSPGGSRCAVGGIAGHNAGTIQNCSFSGSVSGADNVGGITGINAVSGIVEGCRVSGSLTGNHRVGGMVGDNLGVIRSCSNRAEVNTTAEENEVDISDITLDTLTGTESASTVTDIGGIAGSSSGVIRDCKNWGNVGYQHMGYNIGGIAGTQTGYVYKCENFARIFGRKEVGGIVGQMEPTTFIEYTQDTLQILQSQLNTLSKLTNQAVSSVQNSTSDMFTQVDNLYCSIQDARDAVDSLRPDWENPSLPDWDSIEAAKNNLSGSLADVKTSLYGMVDSTHNSMDSLSRTLRSISGQVSAMSATIGSASQNLGGAITDISDQDTETILTGKVENCANSGSVLGDLNAGGIVGAVALENDLDPEDDLQVTGNSSLNFDTQLRAVILGCRNSGSVTVKRQNAGGIVGWLAMGLSKNCLSTGSIDGANADYVGGVAGKSSGYIRFCSAKSAITGSAYVGGIAGKGVTVTDCRSMVQLTGNEKTGAILGLREEPAGYLEEEKDNGGEEQTQSIAGNYYWIVGSDIGGIDGVSYSGCAQPLAQEEFCQLEGLDPVFRTISVRFVYEDGTVRTLSLAPGQALSQDRIPTLPEKKGYVSYWENLCETNLTDIRFDITFRAVYDTEKKTVQSDTLRENGLPIVLAQGQFSGDTPISLTEMDKGPAPQAGDNFLEGYAFTLPAGSADTLRYLPETELQSLRLLVQDADRSWREVPFTRDGRYLVFAIQDGDQGFCLVRTSEGTPWMPCAVCAGAAAVVLIAPVLLIHRRKKQAKKPAETPQNGNT